MGLIEERNGVFEAIEAIQDTDTMKQANASLNNLFANEDYTDEQDKELLANKLYEKYNELMSKSDKDFENAHKECEMAQAEHYDYSKENINTSVIDTLAFQFIAEMNRTQDATKRSQVVESYINKGMNGCRAILKASAVEKYNIVGMQHERVLQGSKSANEKKFDKGKEERINKLRSQESKAYNKRFILRQMNPRSVKAVSSYFREKERIYE